MLRGIRFNHKRFKTEEDYNLLVGLTENTIVLCNNYKLMDTLADEILDTVNGQAEYNDYDCDDEDVGKAIFDLKFGLQRVIDINGQKITLGLEPAIIYKANKAEDIWLFDWKGKNEKYREFIYPMLIFKGSHKVWEDGKNIVYEYICNGKYGCYDGAWVNLYDKNEEIKNEIRTEMDQIANSNYSEVDRYNTLKWVLDQMMRMGNF